MQIRKELHSLKQIRGPDPNYNDICFSGAGRLCLSSVSLIIYLEWQVMPNLHVSFSDVSELSKTFPVVNMVFGNGQKLSLSPENYLFRVSIFLFPLLCLLLLNLPCWNDMFGGASTVHATLCLICCDWLFFLHLIWFHVCVKHSKVHGAYCLGIFQNEKDPTTLLGGNVLYKMPIGNISLIPLFMWRFL